MRTHPPRPRLVFRVGVVGHRPNRLGGAVASVLSHRLTLLLQTVRDEVVAFGETRANLFAAGPPVLRALSPLAEGTDRLFAEAALGLGYELCCPMPFAQAEFEKDFVAPHALEDGSLDRFRGILARAAQTTRLTTFEMDGERTHAPEAYGACGQVLLNQCDLLIVVWDGERLGKRGGTEDTFDDAFRRGVPTIWVHAKAGHAWQIVDATKPLAPASEQDFNEDGELNALRRTVREALDVPQGAPAGASHDEPVRHVSIAQFLDERKPRIDWGVPWKLCRATLTKWRLSFVGIRVGAFEDAAAGEWPRADSSAVARTIDWLRPFYAWADGLAIASANRYRSAFITAYLFAAAAVMAALLPLTEWPALEEPIVEKAIVASELGLIAAILWFVLYGRRRAWHERWIDYRLVAELIRHLRLVAPLGGSRPFPQVPSHQMMYGHPGATWMAWYVRAIERDLGLPTATINFAHIHSCLGDIRTQLSDQIDYHAANAHRNHDIEHRLHIGGMVLLALTILACAVHLFDQELSAPDAQRLIFVCGLLPAVGASLAGISNQGEFRRVAKRSEAMQQHLQQLLARVDQLGLDLDNAPLSAMPRPSARATQLALQAAQLMISEVLDWRVVVLDQPLRPTS